MSVRAKTVGSGIRVELTDDAEVSRDDVGDGDLHTSGAQVEVVRKEDCNTVEKKKTPNKKTLRRKQTTYLAFRCPQNEEG